MSFLALTEQASHPGAPSAGKCIFYCLGGEVYAMDDSGTPVLLTGVDAARILTAGAGLVGGGDLSADRTFDVVAGDGSIVVNANDIVVGIISDAQHGNRGGGALHAIATAGANGFMSAADKTKLDAIFTPYYGQAQSLPISTTTSTTFQNKVQLVTPALVSGDYVLTVSYGWNHDNTGDDFEARIMQNAAQLGELHKQEPQDSAGGGGTGTTQRFYVTRRIVLPSLSGIQTFDLDYRTDAAGQESSIWEATIELEQKS